MQNMQIILLLYFDFSEIEKNYNFLKPTHII